MEYCDINVMNIASTGDVVLTERLDKMLRTDGSLILDFRVMGALEVRNGKIARSTDYLDTLGTAKALESLATEMGIRLHPESGRSELTRPTGPRQTLARAGIRSGLRRQNRINQGRSIRRPLPKSAHAPAACGDGCGQRGGGRGGQVGMRSASAANNGTIDSGGAPIPIPVPKLHPRRKLMRQPSGVRTNSSW